MKRRVYIETSIVSYLTAWPSRDLIKAARQEITLEWWNRRRVEFDLYTSELALEEAAGGDQEAAQKRLTILRNLPLLALTNEIADLSKALIVEGPLPKKAVDDATHLATATIHGIDLLLTWNCKHLANSEMTESVDKLIWAKGYKPPVVCTPDTLMGE